MAEAGGSAVGDCCVCAGDGVGAGDCTGIVGCCIGAGAAAAAARAGAGIDGGVAGDGVEAPALLRRPELLPLSLGPLSLELLCLELLCLEPPERRGLGAEEAGGRPNASVSLSSARSSRLLALLRDFLRVSRARLTDGDVSTFTGPAGAPRWSADSDASLSNRPSKLLSEAISACSDSPCVLSLADADSIDAASSGATSVSSSANSGSNKGLFSSPKSRRSSITEACACMCAVVRMCTHACLWLVVRAPVRVYCMLI